MPSPELRAHRLRSMLAWAVGTAALTLGSGLSLDQGQAAQGSVRRVSIEPRPTGGSALRATVGKPFKLHARLELDNGGRLPLDEHVTWSSSNPSVLRVDRAGGDRAPGWVTPLRPGTAAVTITYPSISGAPPPRPSERTLGDVVTIVVESGP